MAVATQATKYVAFAFFSEDIIFSHALAIIALESYSDFALLHSSLHDIWARKYGSYNLSLLRYAPSDCFETFPFPTQTSTLEAIGETYYAHRQSIMHTTQQGLTKTYNRFHNPDDTKADITHLRQLHTEMDIAVATAYGWQDLKLDHDFHETKQGLRFTISEAARREVLDCLLALNHERYAEEVKQGLHDKKKGKGEKKKVVAKKEVPPDGQIKLFF